MKFSQISCALLSLLFAVQVEAASNVRQQTVVSGSFAVDSAWGGALGSNARVNQVSVNHRMETGEPSLTVFPGDSLSYAYVPNFPQMNIRGGLLPTETVSGKWTTVLDGRNNCTASPFVYDIGADEYSFVLCGSQPAISLTSSNSSRMSCSGMTCTALASGNATVTAQIAETPVKVWGNRRGDSTWVELVSTVLPPTKFVWDVDIVLPPTIGFSVAQTLVPYNTGTTLSWNASNATSCSASGGLDWSGSKPLSGTFDTGNLTSVQAYTLTCTNSAGSVSRLVTVNVDSPNPAPTISLSAKTAVAYDTSVVITWSSTNALTCSASASPSLAGWSGSKPLSGSERSDNLTADTTFILTCSGVGGTTSRFVKVFVDLSPALPTITNFSANPTSVLYNGSTTLSWKTAGTSFCNASAEPSISGWGGASTLSGSKTIANLLESTTFTLTCENGSGSRVVKSILVTVAPLGLKPPTVTLWADSSSVAYNGSTTLHWASNAARSCSLYDGTSWKDVATAGSQSTGSLAVTTQFIFRCNNLAGESDRSLSINVGNPVQPVELSVHVNQYTVPYGVSMPNLWQWQSTNATSCIESDYDTSGRLLWTGPIGLSGSTDERLTQNQVFVIQCSNSLPSSKTVTFTIRVNFVPVPTPSPTPGVPQLPVGPAPTLILRTDSTFISFNTGATLTWRSTNATSCIASSGANGWAGSKPLSGVSSTGNLRGDTGYKMSCSGPGGTVTQSIFIRVGDPSVPGVTMNFWADDFSVVSGKSTRLHWNSTNATSCQASGSWSGNVDLSGVWNTGILTSEKTYILKCSGLAGSVTFLLPIELGTLDPPPTLNFWVDDPILPLDGSRTTTVLRWNSQYATACVASGASGWNGGVDLNGSQNIQVLSPTTYTLECSGPGGTVKTLVSVGIGNTNGSGPQVLLRADSYMVGYNTIPTVYIQSQDTGTCFADWLGGQPLTVTNGMLPSTLFSPLTAATTYTVHCQDSGGLGLQAIAHLTIKVAQLLVCPATFSVVMSWPGVQLNAWYVENALEVPDCAKVESSSFVSQTVANGGVVVNVTNDATWTSTNGTGSVNVSASGFVTAVSEGDAHVLAQYISTGGPLQASSIATVFLPPVECYACESSSTSCAKRLHVGTTTCPTDEFTTESKCNIACSRGGLNWLEVAP